MKLYICPLCGATWGLVIGSPSEVVRDVKCADVGEVCLEPGEEQNL